MEQKKSNLLFVFADQLRSSSVGYAGQEGVLTPHIDAFAKTVSYDPGRAEKGIGSMEEAKAFVESHRPWELYRGTEALTVQPEVKPAPDED